MTGYTRQSTADIQPGQDITASPLNAEFNQLQSAFDASTGHSHDGTAGNAPKIDLTTSISGVLPVANGGIAGVNKLDATVDPTANEDSGDGYSVGSMWINTTDNQLFVCLDATVASAIWAKIPKEISAVISPEATNTVDIGSSSLKYKDAYFAGTVYGGTIDGDFLAAVTASGTLDMDTNSLTGLASPTLTSDAATKGYVDTSISNLIDSAPATLDTLNEIAAALGDDPNFATTITASIATKLPLAGGTMTGNIAMGSNKITGLGAPTTANDATTKTYVDGILGSATSAAASAAAAAVSETNAATSESNAAASYDSFDDRYLGAKASDPILDNDGDALITGAIYWNTTSDQWKVYSGSAWINAVSSLSFDNARPLSVISSSQAITADNRYLVDADGGAVTVTLPASPSQGDTIMVVRVGSSDVTVARNGNNIFGLAEDHTIDVDYAGWDFIYGASGWEGAAISVPSSTNMVAISAGSVIGPGSSTVNNVPQWNATTGLLLKDGLGVGTSANNLVQLDGSSRLPAVDGSQLTNLTSSAALELITETVVSTGVASVEFTGLDTSTYQTFVLEVTAGSHADGSSQSFLVQLSPDSGSTWRTSGYSSHAARFSSSFSVSTNATGAIQNQSAIGAGDEIYFTVELLGISSATELTCIQGQSSHYRGTAWEAAITSGTYTTAEAHDSVRVVTTSGNIDAGIFRIYGLK
jgi:hypothetical protein